MPPQSFPAPILPRELVRIGRFSAADAETVSASANSRDGDVTGAIIDLGLLTDEELAVLKAELYKIPRVDFTEQEPTNDALKVISQDIAQFYKIIPFAITDGVFKVGMLDPENISALDALRFIAEDHKLKLERHLLTMKDFQSGLKRFNSLSGVVGEAVGAFAQDQAQEKALKLDEINAESPVTKVVSTMLIHAIDARASDIHLEPFEKNTRVRFRIDGILQSVLDLPVNLHQPVTTRIKILSSLKIDETRVPQDGRFSIMNGDTKYDFRVSTFPTKAGEKVVMRILDPMSSNVDLTSLGVMRQSKDRLAKAIVKPFGIILITGPTGSGKSTTIAGILKEMNTEEVNIVTLEDPIEYFIDGINQSQTHDEIGYSFANGLRSILRQDPDIVMVGEIRDSETASLAVQAALTGHIVLSTLHTNDALGVIPRLIDMKVEKYLLPPVLTIAAAQRLLRRLCVTCRIKATANEAEQHIIEQALKDILPEYLGDVAQSGPYTIYHPNIQNPCKECGGKAYKGRIAVFEMLEMTGELEKIILGDLSDTAMEEEAKRQGMMSMFQDGILKVLDGICSLEELIEIAQDTQNTKDEKQPQ